MRIVFLILVVLAILAVAIFARRSLGRKERGPFGFREVLKDGRQRELLMQEMNPQDLEKLTDSEVRELVEAYVKTQHQSPEYWAVKELKERAVPPLIDVLKRPESFVRPVQKNKDILERSPAERALEMLVPLPQESLIPVLLPFVQSSEKWQRQEAARHLAATGKESVSEAVAQLLGDPDEFVCTMAMFGLLASTEAKRAEPLLLAATFEPLKTLTVRKGLATYAGDAADLLLRIDRARAIEFLASAAVINTTNPNVARLLPGLTRERIAVPAELLFTLIDVFSTSEKSGGNSDIHGEALKNLALQKHPAAVGLIQKALDAQSEAGEAELPRYIRPPRFTRRKLAAQALCILNDLGDPVKTAFANEEKVGFKRLPLPQQRIVIIVHLDGQVGNGGFSQYFFNSTVDKTDDVAAALEDIGSPECARIFRDAVSVFGKRGPNPDRETRQRQLEKLSPQQDEILDKADKRWFVADSDLDALLYLYALKRKDDFEPLSE